MIQIKKSVGGIDRGGMYRYKAYINNNVIVDRGVEVIIKAMNVTAAAKTFNVFYNENGVRR
jgi:hypothetical protein